MHKKFDLHNTERAFAHLSHGELQKMARLFRLMASSSLTRIGGRFAKICLKLGLPLPFYIKNLLYNQFCGGEQLEDCSSVAQKCAQRNVLINLHYGIEATSTQASWDHAYNENIKAIKWCANTPNAISLSVKLTALISIDILQKKQNNKMVSTEEENAYNLFHQRIDHLCAESKKAGIAIYFDAEESWIQDEIDRLVIDLMRRYNDKSAVVFNTYQMYRFDKLAQFKQDVDEARGNNYFLGAKLVRGAYVVKEAAYAEAHGLKNPIHKNKAAVDHDFDLAVQYGIRELKHVALCIGSHNIHSCELALHEAQKQQIDLNHPHLVFSQLYGMSDPLSNNLAFYKTNISKYMPYGQVKYLLPYLIRRAEENQSVQGQMSRERRQIQKEIKRRKTSKLS